MTSNAKFRVGVQWARRAAALAGLLFFSVQGYAQGCAMCYTTAASARAGAIQALRSGILILLVPPLAMFAGIFVVIYRSRNRFYDAADWTVEKDREWRAMLREVESQESRSRESEVTASCFADNKSRSGGLKVESWEKEVESSIVRS